MKCFLPERATARLLAAVAVPLLLLAAPAAALKIEFDYSYDAAGMFDDPAARAAMEHAGRAYEMFMDDLLAIEPSGGNTWQARFFSDVNEQYQYVEELVPNMVIPADTLRIFAIGQDLHGAGLGIGGPGGYQAGGTREWLDTVDHRGQTGAAQDPNTDFASWGGQVLFQADAGWHYGIDSPPPPGSELNDFLSVAWHELGHAFGFATTGSWWDRVDIENHEFLGDWSQTVHGGPVPLDWDPDYPSVNDSHWDMDLVGYIGDGEPQEAAMAPFLTVGTRKRLTDIDMAALMDIGWEMPLAGDADHDGDVDSDDYIILKRFLGEGRVWEEGDFDFDGDVDRHDLTLLMENYGLFLDYGVLDAPAAPGAVPEPAAATLLAIGGLALLRRRRE